MGSAVLMNLGATPQLECWNTGIMEYWVLGKWDSVIMRKLILAWKSKMFIKNLPLKTNIPLLHHSIIPCVRQNHQASVNICNFSKL